MDEITVMGVVTGLFGPCQGPPGWWVVDQTPAARLLETADMAMGPSGKLVRVVGRVPDGYLDAVAVGVKLRDRPGLAFRAMVEGLSREDIVRELY